MHCVVSLLIVLGALSSTEALVVIRGDMSGLFKGSITVANCRLTCLEKFLHEETNKVVRTDECTERPNCYMCWDYCRMLHKEFTSSMDEMCEDSVCLPGCKKACHFYQSRIAAMTVHVAHRVERSIDLEQIKNSEINSDTENGVQINDNRVIWEGHPASANRLVFVLLAHSEGKWKELSQTTAPSFPIKSDYDRLALLVVGNTGLLSSVVITKQELQKNEQSITGFSKFNKTSIIAFFVSFALSVIVVTSIMYSYSKKQIKAVGIV